MKKIYSFLLIVCCLQIVQMNAQTNSGNCTNNSSSNHSSGGSSGNNSGNSGNQSNGGNGSGSCNGSGGGNNSGGNQQNGNHNGSCANDSTGTQNGTCSIDSTGTQIGNNGNCGNNSGGGNNGSCGNNSGGSNNGNCGNNNGGIGAGGNNGNCGNDSGSGNGGNNGGNCSGGNSGGNSDDDDHNENGGSNGGNCGGGNNDDDDNDNDDDGDDDDDEEGGSNGGNCGGGNNDDDDDDEEGGSNGGNCGGGNNDDDDDDDDDGDDDDNDDEEGGSNGGNCGGGNNDDDDDDNDDDGDDDNNDEESDSNGGNCGGGNNDDDDDDDDDDGDDDDNDDEEGGSNGGNCGGGNNDDDDDDGDDDDGDDDDDDDEEGGSNGGNCGGGNNDDDDDNDDDGDDDDNDDDEGGSNGGNCGGGNNDNDDDDDDDGDDDDDNDDEEGGSNGGNCGGGNNDDDDDDDDDDDEEGGSNGGNCGGGNNDDDDDNGDDGDDDDDEDEDEEGGSNGGNCGGGNNDDDDDDDNDDGDDDDDDEEGGSNGGNCGGGNNDDDDDDDGDDDGNTNTFECPSAALVGCGLSTDPIILGTPSTNSGYSIVGYTDEVMNSGCPQVIVRHWSIADSLGTLYSCDQEITITDTEAPVISIVASGLVDCGTQGSGYWNVVDCDPDPTVVINADSVWSSSIPCDGGALRTQTQGGWGANPNGNNPGVYLHANFDQAFPNGLTIGCNNQLVLTNAQAITQFLPSGSTPSALPSGMTTDPGNGYNNVLAGQLVAAMLNVGFDAYDPSFGSSTSSLGSMVYASGTFQGMTIAQVIAIANEVIGGCSSDYTYSQLNAALTAINENYDNGSVDQGSFECPEALGCVLNINYEISATDACGNTSTAAVSVNLVDDEAPVFPVMPEHITVSCDQIPEPIIDFSGDCFADDITLLVDDQLYSGACYPTIQRTFTANDACGNSTSFTQYITVIDTIAPTFTFVPADITVPCGQSIPDNSPIATDECGDVVVTLSETTQGEGCEQTIQRNWTATDQCGNTAHAQQTIVISDTDGPQITGQAEFTFSCNMGQIAIPVANDACGVVVSFEFADVFTGSGCQQILDRTWTAVDHCGNTSTFVQHIVVADTEAPVFTFIPADMTLACGETAPNSSAVAEDNCGDVELSVTATYLENTGNCSALVRTWTAIDACGNTSFASQYITFEDTIAPVLSALPASYTGNCDELTTAPVLTATDNCDNSVEVVYGEVLTVDGCTILVERTWLAVDDCGNVNSHLQQITIIDDVPPSINSLAEITIGCNELSSVVLDVTDICHTDISVSYQDAIIGSGCSYDIQRLWIATDPCGNTSTFNQIIHIVDTEAPVFSYVPPSMTGVCSLPEFVEQPIVVDLCGGVIQPVLTQSVSGSGCNLTVTRTWTATDACGNSAIATQVISMQDNIVPVITGIPQDITVDCSEYVYPAIPGGIAVTDNCDGVPTLVFHEDIIPGTCPAEFSLVRTWTATDACGNTSTDGYTIFVVDVTPPVFTNTPADITVSCGDLPQASSVQAVDDCGAEVTINLVEQTITGGCPHMMRTWTATDACGNTSTYTQQITIQDNEPPVFQSLPSPGPTTCNNIPPVPDPIVTDNCDDNVQVSFSETMIGTGCEFTLIRMWIAEDDCGNSAVISQSIFITDTAPPVFVQAPAEITVSCSSINGIAPPNVVDDCSGTVMTTFNDVVVGSGCEYIINRTYTATDLCGNTASATQLIHVVDETAPVMSGVPFGTFVNCSNIPSVANVTANDNCSGSIPVQFSEMTIGSGCNYQIVRTWTAADNCGNSTVRTQYIYVNDNAAPVLSGVPANLVLSCDDLVPPASQPIASDACAGSNLPVQFIEFTESTNCGSIITRMWSASDLCGNTVTASQTITITDDLAPVLMNTPAADVFVNCDNIPAAANVVAMDQCSGVITEFDEVYQYGVCPFVIERTWTAIDACGNTSSFVQHIHVSDVIAPILTEVQSTLYLNCGDLIPETIVTADDNCSSELSVAFSEDTTWSGCTQHIHRQWTATDICGNTAVKVQDIFVTDTEAPVFLTTVSDLNVECDEIPQINTPEIEDCNMGQFQVVESIDYTDCISEYTITRRYIATDVCNQTNEMVQTIVVVDTQAPVLSDYPADMDVSCSDIPSIPVIEIIDECDAAAQIEFSEDVTNLAENNVCHLETTQALFGPLAMWLPGINGVSMFYVFDENGGTFTRDEVNGTAHITGHVINTMNAEQGWDLDLKLNSQRNWEDWSALGRSYKDDYGLAANHYLDWTYYELDPTSTLTGTGLLSGSVLTLTHAPADYYYGFQLGQAANNRNAEYGISGWFDYSGTVNGVFESGHGDVNAETNCCPEQMITRTWRVIDCAGNATVHTQVIHVLHDPVAPLASIQMLDPIQLNVNSSRRDYFTIEFSVASDSKVSIDLYDITGNIVDAVFTGEASQGRTYRITYPKSEMDNGLYYFVLSNGKNVVSKSALMMN